MLQKRYTEPGSKAGGGGGGQLPRVLKSKGREIMQNTLVKLNGTFTPRPFDKLCIPLLPRKVGEFHWVFFTQLIDEINNFFFFFLQPTDLFH